MRLLLCTLTITALTLQGQLWLMHDGHRKTRELSVAVAEQRAENAALRERNAALDAEVLNLKKGRAAAEERARTDLGMVGRNETFFQVVPPGAIGGARAPAPGAADRSESAGRH